MFQRKKKSKILIWYVLLIIVIIVCKSKLTFGVYFYPKPSHNWKNPNAPGDLILGIMISIDKQYDPLVDKTIAIYNVRMKRVLALLYAIEMVNRNKKLLPNITLGYDMRNYCHSTRIAMVESFNFVKSFTHLCCDEKLYQDYNGLEHSENSTQKYNRLVAVIGSERSKDSIAVATLLGDYNIPVISYFSSSHVLSDKVRFKAFFRTIPSDINQAKALINLIRYFNWNYVALISVSDSYGDALASSFSATAAEIGICIPIHRSISSLDSDNQVGKIVRAIAENEKVKVILLIVTIDEAEILIEELHRQNVTDRTIIGCDAWISDKFLRREKVQNLDGILGLTFTSNYVDDFEHYLNNINLCHKNNFLWLQEFQEWRNLKNPNSTNCKLPIYPHERINSPIIDESSAARIIDAVYATAYSLHKLLNCTDQYCPYTDFRYFPRTKLIQMLRNITFPGLNADPYQFDSNGDGVTNYYIANMQKDLKTGQYLLRKVGSVDRNLQIFINETEMKWNNNQNHSGSNNPPISRCSEDCLPGTYRRFIESSGCCWNCVPCPKNYFSNNTNSPLCHACQLGFRSNHNRSNCNKVNITNFGLNDPLVIFSSALLFLGILVTLIIWITMCCYQHTPIVKASNFPLTNCLLLGLSCIYIVPAVMLLPKSVTRCKVVFAMLSLSLIFTLVIMTARAHLLYRLFISKPIKHDRTKLIGTNKGYIVIALGVMTIAIVLLIFVMEMDPISVGRYISPTNVAYAHCQSRNKIGLFVFWFFFIMLNLLCLYYAFKIRRIPSNFNEARYIFFASILMCLLLVVVMSANIAEHGPYETGIQVIGITVTALTTTLCIFAPKVYVIYYNIEVNTKKNTVAAISHYSFQDTKNTMRYTASSN